MKALSATELAVMEGTTVYRKSVKGVEAMGKTERPIKRSTNAKLGKLVTAKVWGGMPVYTLTLEERATCSRACAHWSSCYGNNMPFATRYVAGPALEAEIERDLETLQRKHPGGFVLRLHILGDFYSVSYVKRWGEWLSRFPALNVYGYTHWPKGNAIRKALEAVKADHADRFRVRWSGDQTEATDTALSMDDPETQRKVAAKEAFICPEQTGKVEGCGACGLCWMATKPVAFLTH